MCKTANVALVVALFSSISLVGAQSAVSGISVSPGTVEAGSSVTATVTGSAGYCGAVHIDWGDGTAITYATEALPIRQTHVYKTAGTFQLRAQGMGNCAGEARSRIVVTAPPRPAAPAAATAAPRITGVEITPPSGAPGTRDLEVTGTGRCTYTLDYGDGNKETRNSSLPEVRRHNYPAAGHYTVVVTGHGECAVVRRSTFTVAAPAATTPAPRVTGIEVNAPSGTPGTTRDVEITGIGRCTYTVDYGDGQTETRNSALPEVRRHNYPARGQYTIVVKAQGPCAVNQRSTFTSTFSIGPVPEAQLNGSVSRVDARPVIARPGDAITLTVAGTGGCRFAVDLGDGESRTITAQLPHRLTYRYQRVGNYEIVVSPQQPCTGGGDAVLQIRRR